jgi:uncharacterized protein (TIGR02677 family)
VDIYRLELYRYLTAPEVEDYVAIMGRFSAGLLAEWSPQDLVEQGVELPVETIAARCRFLAEKGNLIVSPREVRVTSIAEYQSQPVRYTVSALGARLHREVEEFLAATGGAREVPRELLALVAEGLKTLDPASDPEGLAGSIITIFTQFNEFSRSVTDFYTYIGAVLARSDLDGEEWNGFKHLLLDYLESIVESVRRHTPAITGALERLRPELSTILARASESDTSFAALESSSPGGEATERARGRREADWDQLYAWFAGPGARQLRDAAQQAVGTLLVSLKRINAAATKEASLRRHFLKLAKWFDSSSPDLCHALATSAFGLYGARHLGMPLDDEIADAVPATASWWRSPRAPVPVSLRERGERVMRGRAAVATDHRLQRERLAEEREQEAARRATACAELLAVGDKLGEARLSAPAMRVVLELLGGAASAGAARLPDHPVGLVVQTSEDTFVIRSAMGDLSIDGLWLEIVRPGQLVRGRSTYEKREEGTA